MRTVRLTRGEATPVKLAEALDTLTVEAGADFWIIGKNPHLRSEDEKLYGLDAHDENHLGASHINGSGTAREAAKANFPRSGTQRHIALIEIVNAGERGMTSDEIADKYGLNLYSVKPRIIELRKNGWVEPNGETRKSANDCAVDVHVATVEGGRVVAENESAGSPDPPYDTLPDDGHLFEEAPPT